MEKELFQAIERSSSNCLKYDRRAQVFGKEDVLPLWVADTDFAVPECVTRALQKRIEHPVYGYSLYPDSLKTAVIGWFKRKHNVEIKPEWLMFAPGVMTSIGAFIQAFTEPEQSIIVQPPVYQLFYSAVTQNKRKLLFNPLLNKKQKYEMNFAELETLAKDGAKALIFCSPHNPVGRVWRKDELTSLLDIARRHQLYIASDDIHCDLVFEGNRHQFLFELTDEQDQLITTIAPNKTFNTPAFGLSVLIIKNQRIREKMQRIFDGLMLGGVNPLSATAMEAVYSGEADAWHNELVKYLQANRDLVTQFFESKNLGIKANSPEATFLTWLDCRDLKMTDAELKRFFIEDCGLGLSPGRQFGEQGSGFMRMNLGTQRSIINEALERIEQAILRRK